MADHSDAGDRLAEYRSKRHPDRTPEPAGSTDVPGRDGPPVFVVQHHAASSDHYDVRLEIDGVLVSWAVPKGPSTDPRDKRLAVRTEDHPLDYADFEGTIGQDEYGGGTVLVWDTGAWAPLPKDGHEVDPGQALSDGHLVAVLAGEKLQGAWVFQHTRQGRDDKNWLMVKLADDGADARRRPTSTQPESVLTGRTLEQVARDARRGADARDARRGAVARDAEGDDG